MFFEYFINVFFGVVKEIAFFSMAQLSVPKWDPFHILQCSECTQDI